MVKYFKEWNRLETFYEQITSKVEASSSAIITNVFENEQETKRKNLNSLRIPLWEYRIGKNKDKGKCYLCGEDLTIKTYHISHIEAHSRGGKDELENLQVLCPKCNLSMGNMNMYQYGIEKGYFRREIKNL